MVSICYVNRYYLFCCILFYSLCVCLHVSVAVLFHLRFISVHFIIPFSVYLCRSVLYYY